MYQVSEVTDTSMARLRSIGSVVPACAVPAHGLTSRHAFAARPWQGSHIATMPSLGEGHGRASSPSSPTASAG
jgi:hypothetical protein